MKPMLAFTLDKCNKIHPKNALSVACVCVCGRLSVCALCALCDIYIKVRMLYRFSA